MDAALAFYRDALGGALRYRFPPDGGDPVYVSLAVGSSELAIGYTDAPLPPGNLMLWFYVDDVDRVTTELTAAGATVVEEPIDREWGERTALLHDPFGTRLHLGAPISRPPDEE